MPSRKEPQRVPSRLRPSLAAMLESFDDEILNSAEFKPLEPRRKVANESLLDPFDFKVATKILGRNSLLGDPDQSPERIPSPQAIIPKGDPSVLIPDLDSPGLGQTTGNIDVSAKSMSNSSLVYPQSTSRSESEKGQDDSSDGSNWGTISHRLFTDEIQSSLASITRESGIFVAEFNKLAKKHGLQPLPAEYRVNTSSVSVSSISEGLKSLVTPAEAPPRGALGKGARAVSRILKRTNSTKDISEKSRRTLGHPFGQKKVTVKHLSGFHKSRKDGLAGMHLEEMVSLGGVCEFNLPEKMRPGALLIPTCFHAVASYILAHGLTAPGLFRVEGNPTATDNLYEYYERQLISMRGEKIVQSTTLSVLPNHLTYTVNDVAHVLKKLIAGLPGGLLGSPAVFHALFRVQSYLFPDPTLSEEKAKFLKPRMIALALASLNLHFRLSLVCAVFGLLRCAALSTHEIVDDTKVIKPAEAFTLLKKDALGIIFGPLLLGDKSDQLILPVTEERGGLLVLPSIAPPSDVSPIKGKFHRKKIDQYTRMQREKARRAALVTEMIISNWEDVVAQLRKIGALEHTAKIYEIPGEPSRASTQNIKADSQEQQSQKESTGRSKSSPQIRKSITRSTSSCSRLPQFTEKVHDHLHIRSRSFHTTKIRPSRSNSKVTDLMQFSGKGIKDEDRIATQLSATPLIGDPSPSPIRYSLEEEEVIYDAKTQELSSFVKNLSPRTESRCISEEAKRPIMVELAESSMTPTPVAYDVMNKDGLEPSVAEIFPKGNAIHAHLQTLVASWSNPEPLTPSMEPAFYTESSLLLSDHPTSERLESPFQQFLVSTPMKAVAKDESQKLTVYKESSTFETVRPAPAGERKTSSPQIMTLRKHDSNLEIPTRPEKGRIDVNKSDQTPNGDWSIPGPESIEPIVEPESNKKLQQIVDSEFEDHYCFKFPKDHELPDSDFNDGRSRQTMIDQQISDISLSSRLSVHSTTALYEEITRLKKQLEQRTEEMNQAKKELELARKMANAGTFNQLLRESREEVKMWRNRAEWVERQLKGQALGIIGSGGQTSFGYDGVRSATSPAVSANGAWIGHPSSNSISSYLHDRDSLRNGSMTRSHLP